jgi:propanol-preferring alcohol dehydrogenase
MKAMVLRQVGGPLVLEERPIPTVGPHDALVKVRACGAGLTIHHTVTGASPASLPIVIGHEIAGEVVEVGSAVQSIAVGQRVTDHFYLFCGECRWCLRGKEPLCERTGGNVGRQIDGGYAEYVRLPARNLIPLPDGLPYDERPAEVAVICDAIATPLKVCRRARLQPLESCVVIGAAGGLGVHMVKMARFWGAQVIGVDRGVQKVLAAAEAGAHEVVDVLAEDPVQAIRRLTHGRGADVVVDFVASAETLSNGLRALDSGGRVVVLGVHRGSGVQIDPGRLLRGEQELLGSRYVTRYEIVESLEMVRRGLITPLVSRTFPLEQANEAHALLGREETIGRIALVLEA